MTEEAKVVPKRRFKNFRNTEGWKYCELGEVANIIGGGTPSTNRKEYWDGDIDWYSPVEIGNQIYVDSSQKRISKIGLEKSSARILPIGTVLFTSRAGIGNTAILAKEGATNQGFQSIVPHKNQLDTYFIYSRTHELKQYGEKNGAGSTFVEVSGRQMAKMPMLIPSLEEQKQIGEFSKKLDHLITLHQRKLEKTKALKFAYLSEMFPAEGEKKPRRRFVGFTEDWEQKAISDLADRYDNLRVPITSFNRIYGKTPYYGANGIQDYVEGFTHDGEFILVAEDGANDLDDYPIHYSMGKIWVNNHAHVLKAKSKIADNMFLMNAMKHMNIKPYLVGGGRAKLNADVMMKITIKVPKLEEQEFISIFFSNLNNVIIQHQSKLDKLQKLKKAYLNEIFV